MAARWVLQKFLIVQDYFRLTAVSHLTPLSTYSKIQTTESY